MKKINVKMAVMFFFLMSLLMAYCWAQNPEWRALWIDAWGVGYRTPAEVTQLVNDAKNHNYNAVVIQVRKRGDCYYFPTYPNTEPRATDIAPDFDPLQDTITKAHALGIEVHAWICTYLVASSAPSNPNHVMNVHPEYLTETNTGQQNLQEGYYIDPGHPGSNAWNYNVVMDLVSNYDIDGIHFDYLRYPQLNSGYNSTAIARFNAQTGGSGKPDSGNATFITWRQNQILNWLRATYPDIISVAPNVKVTAAVIANEWWAVDNLLQNWPVMMSEKLLDAMCPMNYTNNNNREFIPRADNTNAKKGQRHCYEGQGAYLNRKENSVTQMKYARSIGCEGIINYSYREPGKSCNTAQFLDYVLANVYQQPASRPVMTWKTSPTGGYLAGILTVASSGAPIDNGTITINGLGITKPSDGEGKYGFVYITPGTYSVTATAAGYSPITQNNVSITAGGVTSLDFQF